MFQKWDVPFLEHAKMEHIGMRISAHPFLFAQSYFRIRKKAHFIRIFSMNMEISSCHNRGEKDWHVFCVFPYIDLGMPNDHGLWE